MIKRIISSSIFFCLMTDLQLQIYNISYRGVYIFRYCPLINVKGYRQNKSTNRFHQIKAIVNLTEWNKKHVLHNLGCHLIINAQLNGIVIIYVQSMSCFTVFFIQSLNTNFSNHNSEYKISKRQICLHISKKHLLIISACLLFVRHKNIVIFIHFQIGVVFHQALFTDLLQWLKINQTHKHGIEPSISVEYSTLILDAFTFCGIIISLFSLICILFFSGTFSHL